MSSADELHSGEHYMLSEDEKIDRPDHVRPGYSWCIGCSYTRPQLDHCEKHEQLDTCWAKEPTT